MALLKHAHLNLLEVGTVTGGDPNPSYPLYRLYDRGIGREYRQNSVAGLFIYADQAALGLAIDRFLIPAGHNLNGTIISLYHSPDNSNWTQVFDATCTESTSQAIIRSWTSIVRRYWRFGVFSQTSIVRIAELFLTATVTWTRNPTRPSGPHDDIFNVRSEETAAGQDRFLIMGSSRRQRTYSVERIGAAQLTDLLALNAGWAGAKPFWLCDHEGTWIYGKLARPIGYREVGPYAYSAQFEFVEVLP